MWLINTHNGIKQQGVKPVDIEDYPAIKKHLDQYFPQLEKRQDKGVTPYNLRNCAYMDDFSKQKIVWGNLNLKAAYCFVEEDIYVCAPCPFVTSSNELLLGVLNSTVADYYIRNLGVTRSGGYFEYKPMFVEQVPVPILSNAEQLGINKLINELVKNPNGLDSKQLNNEINSLVYGVFELDEAEISVIESQLELP